MECGDPVEQVSLRHGMSVDELMRQLARAGAYNGGALARAADIYERMLIDRTVVKFFVLAGAMVPAGMGGIVSDLLSRGYIDVLVSTGANLTHDIIEALGCRHYHGSAFCSDVELRQDEINRIYDVYLPNDAFITFERFIQDSLASLDPGRSYPITGLMTILGQRLESGILSTAAAKGVPVYCPAVADSMIGLSMDGIIANLKEICGLAAKYGALVMVDDSHATGFVGKTRRGSPEYNAVFGSVDIITSTFGKAMGGASGGFTAARKQIVELLRQRSRPYLFSNSLAPVIVYTTLKVLEILSESTELRDRLENICVLFRKEIEKAGFKTVGAGHPIIPIMLGDAKLAADLARDMLDEGVYVIGFSYPVVPKGQARIRTQMSAAHTTEDIHLAIQAFKKVGRKYNVISGN